MLRPLRAQSSYCRSLITALLIVLTLSGCREHEDSIAPELPIETSYAGAVVQDEAPPTHPSFEWLPPVVKGGAVDAQSAFDPTIHEYLEVEICRWSGSACLESVRTFTDAGSGDSRLLMDEDDEQFRALWHMRGDQVQIGETYRIMVRVGSLDLAHVEVEGSRLTLPIHFRVAEGVGEVMTSEGGTLEFPGGQVSIHLPEGALDANAFLTAKPATDLPPGGPPVVPGTAWDLGPDGLAFSEPATLTVDYDPADLPPGLAESELRIHKLVNGVWVQQDAGLVDLENHEVSADVHGFSVFGLLAGEVVLQTRAYVAADGAMSVVDEATRTVVATIPDGGGSPALTPDGSALYASGTGGVNVIDTGTNTITTTIPVDFPGNIAVAPDGDLVYVTSVLGNVVVIETTTNTVSGILSIGGPGDLAVSPDGSRLYVSDPNAGQVYVFDTASRTLVTAIPTSGRPGRVAISPDGAVVYVQARFPDAVELIDAALNQVVAQIPFSSTFSLRDIALSSDGSTLFALGGWDLAVIETATNSVVRSVTVRLTAEQGPARVAASPGGNVAYVTRHDGTDPGDVVLVDWATGEIVATVEVGVRPFGVDIGMVPVSP